MYGIKKKTRHTLLIKLAWQKHKNRLPYRTKKDITISQSVVSDSATPWTAACQASLSFTNSRSLLKLMAIESVIPSNHLILCHPLLLLPSILPSIRAFSNESVLLIKWPKYWSFSFSINPSNECSGLISFRMDWLALLAVQGTLKSHLQHPSSRASILLCSAFFIVQLSHPCMTTGKVTSMLFNMLSRFVIAFLPRKCLLVVFFFFFLFFWPYTLLGMQDLSSQTRDHTHAFYIDRKILNQWTIREVLSFFYFYIYF